VHGSLGRFECHVDTMPIRNVIGCLKLSNLRIKISIGFSNCAHKFNSS